jgi:hypothetical protein
MACDRRQVPVRSKRPASLADFRPGNTILSVHGATTPLKAGFDLKIGAYRMLTQ